MTTGQWSLQTTTMQQGCDEHLNLAMHDIWTGQCQIDRQIVLSHSLMFIIIKLATQRCVTLATILHFDATNGNIRSNTATTLRARQKKELTVVSKNGAFAFDMNTA